MSKYELYIINHNGDGRCIYDGNDKNKLDKIVLDNQEEVITNADKYFHLVTPFKSIDDFYSYRDFVTYTIKQL